MKYMMFVVVDPERAAEVEFAACRPTIEEWLADVDRRGSWVAGAALRAPGQATTVRISEGRTHATAGCSIESGEWIVGFDILECASLDEAIEIAARHPQADGGKLELRPFWIFDS